MSTYNAIKYNVSFANAGGLKLIKTLTASSDSTLSFVDGSSDVVLDSTYKEYLFIFNDIHSSGTDVPWTVQFNAAGGSGFDETITSTYFDAYHIETDSGGSPTDLRYMASGDQAQGTGYQWLANCTNGNDENVAGYMHLFDPSNTTFVKHFISRCSSPQQSYANDSYVAGYINTTSAIDEVSFKMTSGNIDAGTIQLFGVVS
jgi:hypothetical protein|tara:strand:+ start:358 stop:963 length:606 start_codon:yes stop_codon:yes gene_type:complete